MAFERIGLGAFLSFDGGRFVDGIIRPRDELGRFVAKSDQATFSLGRLKAAGAAAFQALGQSMNKMAMGASKVQSGLLAVSMAMAPLTLAVHKGAGLFIDFEQQMRNVQSVSNMTDEQFGRMIAKSKQLGATTKFTATQAGEGFENLARAGFTADEQMSAIDGTLALAAADSIDLATATDITASVVRAMGLEAREASRVADVLAQTSANSNTNVIGLGEAFKFAAPIAKRFGLTVEETALALGLTANAGLKGTLSGTSFKNMLLKLAKPTEKAAGYMKKYGITVYETAEGNLDFRKTLDSVVAGTKGIHSSLERARVVAEMFGMYGQGAVSALATAIEKGQFDTLASAIDNAQGAAKRMADTRMDSFHGQILLLTSSMEGFAIELFGPFVSMAEEGLKKHVIPFISDVVTVLQELIKPTANVDELRKKFGMAAEVAFGVADAMRAIREGANFVVKALRDLGSRFQDSLGNDAVRKIAKWAVLMIIFGAVMTPVLLAFVAIGLAIGGLISIVSGVVTFISGAFLPVLLVLGAIALVLLACRRENEGLYDTAMRVWASIKAWAIDAWYNGVLPFWEGVKDGASYVLPYLERTWIQVSGILKEAIIDLFRTFGYEIDGNKTDWRSIGEIAVVVLGSIIDSVLTVGTFIVVMIVTAIKFIKAFGIAIGDWVVFPFAYAYGFITEVGASLEMLFSGNMIEGFKRLGTALLNFVLEPLRFILRQAIRIADAVSVDIPQGVRDFANEGFVLAAFQTEAPKATFGERGAPGFLDKPLEVQAAVNEAMAAENSQEAFGDAFEGGLNKYLGEGSPLKTAMDTSNDLAKNAPCVDNNVSVAVDGAEIARSQTRHQAELKDRAGFKTTPWQRRVAAEMGAAPVRG